jgi:hypothetical protein
MAGRSPLLTLPVETLTAIFVDLLPNRSDSLSDIDFNHFPSTLPNEVALRGVAHTSRRLRQVAIPLLYHRVNVSVHDSTAYIRLVRHFSRFPGYGGLVRDLVIKSDGFDTDRLSTSQSAFLFDEARRQGIQGLVSGMDTLFPLPALMLALILRQTPNIQKLGIRALAKKGITPGIDLATRLPGSFMLDSLRQLDIRTFSMGSRVHIEPVTALLRHTSSLSSLRIGRRAGRLSTMIQTPQPQLKELHLLETSPEDLANIARLCPRLERFRVGDPRLIFADVKKDLGESLITVGAILKGLLPLAATLREVYLDWPPLQTPGPETPRIEGLELVSHFGALRCLYLGLGTWPAGDPTNFITELPRGIESLYLRGRNFPTNNIAHLLSTLVRAGRLPKLKSYQCALSVFGPELNLPYKIARAFEETGVACTTHGFPRA